MTPELEQKLMERFGNLLDLRFYGGKYVRCEDGWFVLIWMFLQDVEAKGWDVRFDTIKEKWGWLHIYPPIDRFPFMDNPVPPALWDMIDEVARQSYTTCEFCGNPGTARYNYSWFRVLCDGCEATYDKISPRMQFESFPTGLKSYIYPRGSEQWKQEQHNLADDIPDSFAAPMQVRGNILPTGKALKRK